MSYHILKTDPIWWDRIADGSKTAEVRRHDRDFHIGDRLLLVRDEWDKNQVVRVIEATVSHVLPASVFPDGLQVGYSVLSLVNVGCERLHDVATELRPAAEETR